MSKFLNRDEVDKILGIDNKKRVATESENNLIVKEIKKREKEKSRKLIKNEIAELMQDLNLLDIDIIMSED